MRRLFARVTTALLFAATTAAAEPTVTIDAPRIHLGDIVSSASGALASADLGNAPPPGSSRLISRSEILRQLGRQGLEPKRVRLPSSVRVKSAARRIDRDHFAQMVALALGATLETGVDLVAVRPSRGIVVSPRARIARVMVPRLPRRTGNLKTTALVEIETDGVVQRRVPVSIVLEIGEEAARPDVPRGSRVTLVIARRSAEITMSGIALTDADVGDVVQFRVERTGKVLRARVRTPDSASVVAP